MIKKFCARRVLSVLICAVLLAGSVLPLAMPAHAENTVFITDIELAFGSAEADKLEASGWSVMMVGLNVTPNTEKQVYIAYKTDGGSPVTNVLLAKDFGSSLKGKDGCSYTRAGDTDVDAGIGGGTGCLYFTREKAAGEPLVALQVLRSTSKALYTITNDGAELVKTASGVPADFERENKKAVLYLAMIRDGMVKPYVSDVGVVTDTDKWNAVYTACERGYNYYVDGDMDENAGTYTLLVYNRTADVKKAVTNITAVSEESVKAMEKEAAAQDLDGSSIKISNIDYSRISKKPIAAKTSYYLYVTKSTKAGNAVSMLTAQRIEEPQNILFGTWIDSYYSAEGVTDAHLYSVNESLFSKLRDDLTVLTQVPVKFLDNAPASQKTQSTTSITTTVPETTTQAVTQEVGSEDTTANAESVSEPASETPTEQTTQATSALTTEPTTEEEKENKIIGITMLTKKEGLPESVLQILGLNENIISSEEDDRRSERENKFGASVFTEHGGLAFAIGSAVIVAAGISAFVLYRKKKGAE